MKTKKTMRHDSLTFKISDGEFFARLSIGRSGWRIAYCGESMLPVAQELQRLFDDAMARKLPYGQAVDEVEAKLLAANPN